jgi:hypothetical protein
VSGREVGRDINRPPERVPGVFEPLKLDQNQPEAVPSNGACRLFRQRPLILFQSGVELPALQQEQSQVKPCGEQRLSPDQRLLQRSH